jgi:acyl-CoA thioester hydrolase
MTGKTFVWPVRVYYEDSDAQGVVYYANYFKFMERARTEWIRSLGIEQDTMMRKDRRIFVVVDTTAQFLSPARFNDQLAVTVRLTDLSRATFSMGQDIFRNNIDGELLCRGTIRAAFLNADTLKPARLPDTFFKDISI